MIELKKRLYITYEAYSQEEIKKHLEEYKDWTLVHKLETTKVSEHHKVFVGELILTKG
jgi:hypothetical protein